MQDVNLEALLGDNGVTRYEFRFDPLDGNHRLASAEIVDRTAVPAYVVTEPLTETQRRVRRVGQRARG